MTLSLQNISDRLEIEELLIQYCDTIDSGHLNRFDEIFSPDAVIDYSNFGGPKGSIDIIKAFLTANLGDLPKQHMMANLTVKVNDDTATARSMCFNPQAFPDGHGGYQMAFFGLWYEDLLIRTKDGWRIQQRVSKPAYHHNIPK